MRGLHPLDRTIGTEWPVFGSDADVRAFETTPFADRIAAPNTYEALRVGAARDPDAAALLFLRNADPEEAPVRVSHREFFGRLTQVANMLHGLGVGPDDVVSLLLPLLPQSFCALFGAEAAGIANPVNPLLEAAQIAEILRAAKT
jgi:fatty-acyl-CoA synthase